MEDNGKKKRSPYFKISVYVFCVGALLLLFNRLLDSMGDLFAWVRTAWSTALTTMMPFLIAIVLAYLFRPLVEKLMGLIARLEPASGRRRALDAVRRRLVKSRRFVAACVLYILVVALLVVTLAYVVPTTVMNVIELVQNMPGYVSALLEWVNDNVTNNAEIPAAGAPGCGCRCADAQLVVDGAAKGCGVDDTGAAEAGVCDIGHVA